jgi:hypothetical protein
VRDHSEAARGRGHGDQEGHSSADAPIVARRSNAIYLMTFPISHAAMIIEVPWHYSRGAVDLSIIRQAFTSWSHTAPHAEQVWRRVLGLLESRIELHMLHRQVLTAS